MEAQNIDILDLESAARPVPLEVRFGEHCRSFTEWTSDQGRVFESFYAIDTETTEIDRENPQIVPALVLATACDDTRGVLLSRNNLPAFLRIHHDLPLICHNAAFDLKVMQRVLGEGQDLYGPVEHGRVWDTLVLRRLLSLASWGHSARGDSSLAASVRDLLGLELPKEIRDEQGGAIRTGFGRYLGRPLSEIPSESLRYAAGDPLATWLLFWRLHAEISAVLRASGQVWGFVNESWLTDCVRRFGPLTHHVQLRAAILADVLESTGIGIDAPRRDEKAQAVERIEADCKARLRRRGYLPGEPGNSKALQAIIAAFHRADPEIELRRTETGKYATAEEDIAELVSLDQFFRDYITHRAAQKLRSTYLGKMCRKRLHARFGYLLSTGRMSCGGGFNLQNLPREADNAGAAPTIRSCFVPAEGNVFIDADYSQIELVVLAHALSHQFGFNSRLTSLINEGKDIHYMLASILLDKPPEQITKDERQGVKPVSFGRPGVMGPETLQRLARSSYGIELAMEEVEQRIEAYHRLCPELDVFLADEVDIAEVLARSLGLTTAAYREATGRGFRTTASEDNRPQPWLGWMLLKTIKEQNPCTKEGREYTAEELDFFWSAAGTLSGGLKPELEGKLRVRQADRRLWQAVRDQAGRRSVFTLTGRLRAGATFCSSRNCIFQGGSADGAIMGMWKVWRAGYKLVDFVHDQVVVEVKEDDFVERRRVEVVELMRQGMLEVIPGMNVKVDAVVTRSLNKAETVPGPAGMPHQDESRVAEHPEVGSDGLPIPSSSGGGSWSKETLVEQEAQRDGS